MTNLPFIIDDSVYRNKYQRRLNFQHKHNGFRMKCILLAREKKPCAPLRSKLFIWIHLLNFIVRIVLIVMISVKSQTLFIIVVTHPKNRIILQNQRWMNMNSQFSLCSYSTTSQYRFSDSGLFDSKFFFSFSTFISTMQTLLLKKETKTIRDERNECT